MGPDGSKQQQQQKKKQFLVEFTAAQHVSFHISNDRRQTCLKGCHQNDTS